MSENEKIVQTFCFENLFLDDEPILNVSTPENMLLEIKVRKDSNRVIFNILKGESHFNELSDVILEEGENPFTFIDYGESISLIRIGDFEVMYVFPGNAEFRFYNFDSNKWREGNENEI